MGCVIARWKLEKHELDSIVHPEADDLRELQTAFEEANETAANRRWCTFGNVDRNDQRGSAHCKAYKRSSGWVKP
jgi:hypothetical protein